MAHTILYIATSRDGFIADKQGGVDWLPHPDSVDEDFGFEAFLNSIDVIAQGSRTFLQTLSFIEQRIVPDLPYNGKHMYVFTREPMTTTRTDVTFVSSIAGFLDIIHARQDIHTVWLLGGAELIESFAQHDLIDEAIITIMPVDLHEGIALPTSVYKKMQEVETKYLPHDMLEKRYVRNSLKSVIT